MQISVNQEEIRAFCRRWKVSELAFFGSVLRHDFKADSDVDVMVSFSPEAAPTLFDMVHMQRELSQILGHDVDLVSRRGIEAGRNHLRKHEVLSSAEAVYES